MSVRNESILMENKKSEASGLKDPKLSAFLSNKTTYFANRCLVLAAGSLWGLMGILVRSLNATGLSSMEIAAIRSTITCISLFAGMLLFNRKAFRIKWKDIWCFIGTGACSVTFFNYCYFKTMTLTSLSVAAVLLYTAPAIVMLMSAFLFKEKLTVKKIAALFLAFLGCAFVSGIVGGAGTLSVKGILFGLGAGFGYALYSIFGRYALERGYSSLTISFYTFLCSSVCTFFFADWGEIVSALSGNASVMIRTVVLVLIVTLLPYLSYTRGLNGLENGTASVLASIEPVVATLVGVAIYKETLNMWNVMGICLVLGSIVLINVKGKGKKRG